MTSLRHGLSAVLLVIVGGLAGAWVSRIAWPPVPPTPEPEPRGPTANPRAPASSGLVCVRELPRRGSTWRDAEDEDATLQLRLRLGLCEARLDDCNRAKAVVRHAWPEQAAANEDATAFHTVVEQALADCGLANALELIECSEYPCVAALRPTGDDPTALQTVNAAIDACAPLREAFEVGEGQAEALEVYAVRVPCKGGDQTAHVLAALNTKGQAWADMQANDGLDELLRRMYRRGDDVAAIWNCAPE